MFVITENKLPIKVWLKSREDVEPTCLEQAGNLANLPFAFHHIALMPDTHAGFGMPIGGILATKGVIIPSAVGVDIGCGMGFIHTNIPASLLYEVSTPNGALAQQLVGAIMRNVPVGFSHHSSQQPCAALDRFVADYENDQLTLNDQAVQEMYPGELLKEIDSGYYQVGTLGGGNHFIELQADEQGNLAIMLHSGSRNFGLKICKHFDNLAKDLNEIWCSNIPANWQLAFLPVETKTGQAYIKWMSLALDFARENRQLMMERVKNIVFNSVEKYAGFRGIEISMEVNAHHNYAALEHHFGSDVWVHRKGAIRVRDGEYGIIPGAMGSYSYIVTGQGSAESFHSCSHGAGRRMSRNEAKKTFDTQRVMEDLKLQGVVLGVPSRDNITDECRWAYKDIDDVIANELDLVTPVMKLKTLAVIKGAGKD